MDLRPSRTNPSICTYQPLNETHSAHLPQHQTWGRMVSSFKFSNHIVLCHFARSINPIAQSSQSCLVLVINLQIPWRGNTQMGREHAYGLCASSRLLKVDRESASATEAGMLFLSGMVRNEKECQSGECLSLARGRCKLSWFLEPRAGLLARDILIVSGGIAISPWSVLYIRVKRWCRRRSANSLHPSFLRRPVTLATPYSPQAQRAAFLWTCQCHAPLWHAPINQSHRPDPTSVALPMARSHKSIPSPQSSREPPWHVPINQSHRPDPASVVCPMAHPHKSVNNQYYYLVSGSPHRIK